MIPGYFPFYSDFSKTQTWFPTYSRKYVPLIISQIIQTNDTFSNEKKDSTKVRISFELNLWTHFLLLIMQKKLIHKPVPMSREAVSICALPRLRLSLTALSKTSRSCGSKASLSAWSAWSIALAWAFSDAWKLDPIYFKRMTRPFFPNILN